MFDFNEDISTTASCISEKYSNTPLGTSLISLVNKNDWTKSDWNTIELISFQANTSKKLYSSYDDKTGKPDCASFLIQDATFLSTASKLLFKAFQIELNFKKSEALVLKRANTFLKVSNTWGSISVELKKPYHLHLDDFFAGCNGFPSPIQKSESNSNFEKKRYLEPPSPIVPLTLLFYEGPIARSYVETFSQLGLKPKRIVQLISETDLITKKKSGSLLPKILRQNYREWSHQQKIHYWPNYLKKRHKDVYDAITNEIGIKLGFSKEMQIDAHGLKDLSEYADTVEKIEISNLQDDKLYELVKKSETQETFLFTGGGILPKKYIEVEGKKYIHIHPGMLPNLRGADCLLWSKLIYGKASSTCLYLDSGIDTGGIIKTSWIPEVCLPPGFFKLPNLTQYRIIYSFLDPWIRSFVLRQIISGNSSFNNLKVKKQAISDGVNFHFMHENIREIVFRNWVK